MSTVIYLSCACRQGVNCSEKLRVYRLCTYMCDKCMHQFRSIQHHWARGYGNRREGLTRKISRSKWLWLYIPVSLCLFCPPLLYLLKKRGENRKKYETWQVSKPFARYLAIRRPRVHHACACVICSSRAHAVNNCGTWRDRDR